MAPTGGPRSPCKRGEKKPTAVAYRCKQMQTGHFVVTTESRPLDSMLSHFFGEEDSYHPNELYATLYSRL